MTHKLPEKLSECPLSLRVADVIARAAINDIISHLAAQEEQGGENEQPTCECYKPRVCLTAGRYCMTCELPLSKEYQERHGWIKEKKDTPEQPTQEWCEIRRLVVAQSGWVSQQDREEHLPGTLQSVEQNITRLLSHQKQELLEKVRGCVPEELGDYLVGYNKGWNACRNRFLSNLDSLSKGV